MKSEGKKYHSSYLQVTQDDLSGECDNNFTSEILMAEFYRCHVKLWSKTII